MADKQPSLCHVGPGLRVGQRVHLQVRMPKSFFPNATYMKCETPTTAEDLDREGL